MFQFSSSGLRKAAVIVLLAGLIVLAGGGYAEAIHVKGTHPRPPKVGGISTKVSYPWLNRFGVVQAQPVPGGGVQILAIRPGSPADRSGLDPLDIVLAADGNLVFSLGDLNNALRNDWPSGSITLHVFDPVNNIDEPNFPVALQ
jgi:S1-C subfamily serine protease